MASLDLADYNQEGNEAMEVDFLIGCDYYWRFTTGERRRADDGPVALYTKFGWVLSGMLSAEEERPSAHNLITTHVLRIDARPSTQDALEEIILQSFWKLESMGVESKTESVLEEFTQTVQFKNGRYEISLPRKSFYQCCPSTTNLAKSD